MKKIIGIVLSLLLSIGIVIVLPMFFDTNNTINSSSMSSLINQDSTLTDQEHECTKIYSSGKLIGVITDLDYINEKIDEYGDKYKDVIPNAKLGFNENIIIEKEKNNNEFENIDDKIFDYLVDNNLIGVHATAVELSQNGNVFDIIYVLSIDDFYNARDEFLLNFVDENTLNFFKNNSIADEISDYGTIDYSMSIAETISYSDSFASLENIFLTQDEIFNYLCYGRNTERTYYTTKEGDTLQGVGGLNGNLSTEQLYSINKDVLSSPDQVITPGMELNVTYFTSPLTVTLTKHTLTQETITPDNPKYEYTTELASGQREVVVEEKNGSKNVLYEETWINGVLQTGKELSSIVTEEPVQGLIKVGQDVSIPYQYYAGIGNFIPPVDNPHITCRLGCYSGHNGTDIVNYYWTNYNIYATDSGTIETIGYDSLSGYYVIINHNNGYRTKYNHMREKTTYVIVGQAVERGDIIGTMGMTGYATGVHVHYMIIYDGTPLDACMFLDCDSFY